MKKNLIITGIAAGLLAASPMARANLYVVDSSANDMSSAQTSSMPSTVGGPVPLTVSWEVNFNSTSLVYTYNYEVTDPANEGDTVDSFNVGAISTFITGGNYNFLSPNGPTWDFVINPGQTSSDLYFTSLTAPILGTGNSSDSSPPSPWSTYPNGNPIPVPGTVPDGGMTMVMLGGAFCVLGAIRRKLA